MYTVISTTGDRTNDHRLQSETLQLIVDLILFLFSDFCRKIINILIYIIKYYEIMT